MPTKDRAGGSSSAALIGISALAIGFFAGYVIGKGAKSAVAPNQPNQPVATQETNGATPLPPIPSGPLGIEERHAVLGTVVSLEGSTLTINVKVVDDPSAGPTEKTLRVMLTESTTITKQTARSDEELAAAQAKFEADQTAFLKTPPSPTAAPPEPPLPYETSTVTAADIRQGQYVLVRSAAPIGSSGTIEAESVSIVSEKSLSTTEGGTPFPGAVAAPDEPPPAPAQ